jgi:hypothetical protein
LIVFVGLHFEIIVISCTGICFAGYALRRSLCRFSGLLLSFINDGSIFSLLGFVHVSGCPRRLEKGVDDGLVIWIGFGHLWFRVIVCIGVSRGVNHANEVEVDLLG